MRHDAVPTISFHRAGGGSYTLGAAGSAAPVRLARGATGLGIAPPSFATSPKLAGHGSVKRGKRLNERDTMLPVMLSTSSMSGLNDVREDLVRFLSPLDERELTLRVDVPGRDRWREIPVDYAGGLEGDFDDAYHGTWEKRVLEFKATEALWRGEPVRVSKQTDTADAKPFLSATQPFFPVILADSTVAGQLTVDVQGDAPTYPVWTITPPGSDLLIRNRDTGARFYLDGLLTETIHLDMEIGRLWSASDPTGETYWDRVDEDFRMFALQPGRNQLDFSLVGATDASEVNVTYSPRFLAGY